MVFTSLYALRCCVDTSKQRWRLVDDDNFSPLLLLKNGTFNHNTLDLHFIIFNILTFNVNYLVDTVYSIKFS